MRLAACLCLAAAVAGCGGDYILTAPDQLAAAGEEATVVVRLQRNDFFVLALPVERAAMTFQTGGLHEVGAYTDQLGYAGTRVPVPSDPGQYDLRIAHLDIYGDDIHRTARLFVWDKQQAIVAVDLDALPWKISPDSPAAVAAINRLARDARIVYLTRQEADQHRRLGAWLDEMGYPDGPILLWQHKKWHIVPGTWRIPRIVIEDEMVSRLPELRKAFANFSAGVSTGALAAEGFADAGLQPVLVGTGSAGEAEVTRRASWQDLAEKGL